MSMIDFPKIDSQGFFHDWNGFAMDRFNDPHLPSAGFTRRGVHEPPRLSQLPGCRSYRLSSWSRLRSSPSERTTFRTCEGNAGKRIHHGEQA